MARDPRITPAELALVRALAARIVDGYLHEKAQRQQADGPMRPNPVPLPTPLRPV